MLNEFKGTSSQLINHLMRDGLLTKEKVGDIKPMINQDTALVSYLIKQHILSSEVILSYCKKKFGLPFFDLQHYDKSLLQDHPIISFEFIYRYRILPLKKEEGILYIGMSDPTVQSTLEAVTFHTGLIIRQMLVCEIELDRLIKQYCSPLILDAKLRTAVSKVSNVEEASLNQAFTDHEEEPIVDFVNRLIEDAILKQVSDIHIEPYEHFCRIRFRLDGLLHETASLPIALSIRIITRLKIMAHLNIAERRIPQDGRIYLNGLIKAPVNVDLRISTCPTLFGEKIVLRLLDTNPLKLGIDKLGLTHSQKILFLEKLKQPQGIILISGPTGSGKTVTLYSALHHLNQIEKNISSVEDPVEMSLPGINQVSINQKIGIDFPSILRTFLRQDPDIIMVGEIRDTDTARIAIQASQTGHLVLSTLHANNALETINRLNALGIPADRLSQAQPLLIAQRLVRKLCQICKKPEKISTANKQEKQMITYQPVGCDHCQNGYKGRVGIFEIIQVNNAIASAVTNKKSMNSILYESKNDKWLRLRDSGLLKIQEGFTTQEELQRVIGNEF